MTMIAQSTLFPAMNQWPKPGLVECFYCGCLVMNDYSALDKHVRWHEFITLIGVTVNHAYMP